MLFNRPNRPSLKKFALLANKIEDAKISFGRIDFFKEIFH